MAGHSMLAIVLAVLAAIVVILGAIFAAATAALATAAGFTIIGIADKVIPDIQPLTALALTPNQAMIMAALQAGSLTTITELMQQINLVIITASL